MEIVILRIAGGGSNGKGQTTILLVTEQAKELKLLTSRLRLRTPYSPRPQIERSRSLRIDQNGIFERLHISRRIGERTTSRLWGEVSVQFDLVPPRFSELAQRLIAAPNNPISAIHIDGPHFLSIVCDESFNPVAAGYEPKSQEELRKLIAFKLGASIVEHIETRRTKQPLPCLATELESVLTRCFSALSLETAIIALSALHEGLRDHLKLPNLIAPEYQMYLR